MTKNSYTDFRIRAEFWVSDDANSGIWNTYDVAVKGTRLRVTLNGVVTADIQDNKFTSGPIALQYAAGVVKFRKVQISPL